MKAAAVLAVVVLSLSACGSVGGSSASAEKDDGLTISGSIRLTEGESLEVAGRPVDGATCYGTGGYDDMSAGTQVIVSDQDGTTIGTSQLSGGEIVDAATNVVPTCEWTFEVPVEEAKFYDIEVSHRGSLQFSHEDMEEKDWKVSFTL